MAKISDASLSERMNLSILCMGCCPLTFHVPQKSLAEKKKGVSERVSNHGSTDEQEFFKAMPQILGQAKVLLSFPEHPLDETLPNAALQKLYPRLVASHPRAPRGRVRGVA